ncbi:hypothetical protein [Bacteroides sp.]|uniref:hypothetical protein n=1 Tax=Bacteroides sp. TaxID=29523 RepID=UPI00262BF945|nr:hypothetical protein [Bacteroides sp.]MDD3039723.1 hypothetical protein [Bacteroides sp.]
MLFHIPIEPYETRYTADWVEQYERAFKDRGIVSETILGDQTTSVLQPGCVLDACGTHIYKLSQLSKIIHRINSGRIKNNDVIFFSDLWFPGIESLFYIRNMTKIDFKIVGVLHAGTYDQYDFTCQNGMRSWGAALERCWFNEFDMIFVATAFHKHLIMENTPICCKDKIKVTGLPFYAEELRKRFPVTEKENLVVFPHRIVPEKQPWLFDEIAKMPELSNFKFIYTMKDTTTRDEYFRLLAKSKIMLSFAGQETFGYSTLEAMALGNIALVPNRLSYKETVPYEWRYDTFEELKLMLKGVLTGDIPQPLEGYPNLKYWANSINRMLTELISEGYNV